MMGRVTALIGYVLSGVEMCLGPSRKIALWRARGLCESEQYVEAFRYVSSLLERWPDLAGLHYYAGRAGIGLVNLQYAQVRMAYAATLAPNDSRYRFGLAYCAQRRGQLEVAAREYRASLALDPDDLNARLNLGLVLKSQDKLSLAIETFDEVLAKRPKDLKALFGSALCAHRLGHVEEAIERAEGCIRLDRRHGKSHALLGSILMTRGESARALEHFQIAGEQDPEDGSILAAMGRLHMPEDPARGRHLLREALIVARADRSAHFDLGQYYERVNKLERASAEYALYVRFHEGKRAQWARRRIQRLNEKREKVMARHAER